MYVQKYCNSLDSIKWWKDIMDNISNGLVVGIYVFLLTDCNWG